MISKLPVKAKLLGIDARNRWKKVPFYFNYLRNHLRTGESGADVLRSDAEDAGIAERVNYYNRIDAAFSVKNKTPAREALAWRSGGGSAYAADLFGALRGIDPQARLDYYFGDSTRIPASPAIIKARPIAGDNRNAVLLKLNSARHFHFVRDPLPFAAKKNMAVWRGNSNKQAARQLLVKKYHAHPLCDVGGYTKRRRAQAEKSGVMQKPSLSISKQLAYKFIISIEGNDVATNTKWIMSSNSLCFMPKPKCETWFMEGELIPNFHYVLLADDFSDLEEKIEHYSTRTDEALAIIENARRHVTGFQNPAIERLIARRVIEKYLHYARPGKPPPAF